jgi:alanyl-tRNA synthetase
MAGMTGRRIRIKSSDIRRSFVDYFKSKGHKEMVSSPVIPFDDPTILFANAGMNQFKDIFTGKKKAEYKRAVTVQKCMRAGGKHNDLENVGRTGRHQTFFEMLGNFSFGDYFKEEAISFGWEWISRVLKLPPDRLYATVYDDDDEAFRLWEKIAPELKNGRILRFGKESNYWSMGEIGPNGPCSEIHYDRGKEYSCGKPDCFVNCECDRYVEIWNLVFMQYNQKPDGTSEPLPRPSVDTGAGLERITAVIQKAYSNYETDLFKDILEHISQLCGRKYDSGEKGVSHRVIADHLRALTFCIADGGGLSNEKQGYVLRRILRRAARHGRLLDMHEPFVYKLVPTLVGTMGSVYPEIRQRQKHIENVISSEEEAFGRTLDNGLELFDDIVHKVKSSRSSIIPGDEVFKLYDTYGFPVDLTEVMAQEKGLMLDMEGFERAMTGQQEKSRNAAKFQVTATISSDAFIDGQDSTTLFIRNKDEINSEIINAFSGPDIAERVDGKTEPRSWWRPEYDVDIILEKTPFYVESGGQVGDIGIIENEKIKLNVLRVSKFNDFIVHTVRLIKGHFADLKRGVSVVARIDWERRWDVMRNHTATHLLHAALRQVLGEHVHQSGSYVGPDKLRFDFSHFKPMTVEESTRVEEIVNMKILEGSSVNTIEDDLENAKKSGAMAIFGEKYGSRVRVVSVDDFSKELCGGTHVENVSQIGPFMITLETGIASGVRRIEAITGRVALAKIQEQKRALERIAGIVNRPAEEAAAAVEDAYGKLQELQKENKKLKTEKFAGGAVSVGTEIKIGSLVFRYHDFGDVEPDEMAGWVDSGKGVGYPLISAAIGNIGGKKTYMASGSGQVKLHIGNISRDLLKQFGGRGGGKESFAQGTVPSDTNSDKLFEAFESRLREESKKG